MKPTKNVLLSLVPAVLFLLVWEGSVSVNPKALFFFSKPTLVLQDFWQAFTRDRILVDCLFTLIPALMGLTLAVVLGGAIGFLMILFPRFAKPFEIYVAALGSFPIFAIAPMTIIWFGLGFGGKVFLSFLSAVFIFLAACYKGGTTAPAHLVQHFLDHDASELEITKLLRVPSAIDWMVSAFKQCANMSLLGVFVGEFVASERGLGRVMLSAGSLYDVKRVITAALLFACLALLVSVLGDWATKHKRWIITRLTSTK
jgi:NitT/TauT family transport system permease protein